MFALDVDGQPGLAALADYARRGLDLPETLAVSTGRGSHIYFSLPDKVRIGTCAGKFAHGLDVRGEGGQCILPPSVHFSGVTYVYDNPGARLAAPPDWLLELLAHPETKKIDATIGLVYDGGRNDAITRYGGALRRRGAGLDELRTELLAANERRCVPPLASDEVEKIAHSLMRYEPGGPDPLERAWQAVLRESHPRGYLQFLALVSHLQSARPGLPVAIPLERIATLMHVDWTQVRRWRRYAVNEGKLKPQDHYVRLRRAATYIVKSENCPNSVCVPVVTPNSDLVGQLTANGTPMRKGHGDGYGL